MKSITKRDIVIHLSHEKVLPTNKKFKEECQKLICDMLSIKPEHLNSQKLNDFVKNVKNLYRKSGLYLSFWNLEKGI